MGSASAKKKPSTGAKRPSGRRKRQVDLPDMLILVLISLLYVCRLFWHEDPEVTKSRADMTYLSPYDAPCYLAAKYESSGTCETCAYYTVDGDVQFACGEFQFDATHGCLTKFVDWAYEQDPVFYSGFEPFLEETGEQLRDHYVAFTKVWKALAKKDYKRFEGDQCHYEYIHYGEPAFKSYGKLTGFDFSNASDAVQGVVIAVVGNYGRSGAEKFVTGIKAGDSDREVINKICHAVKKHNSKKYESSWKYIHQDALNLLRGKLNIYKKDENKRADIDWSWKLE